MSAVLQAFDFESLAVRVVIRDEQPWFVAADVCRVLDIANNRDAVAALDTDEKADVGITDTSSNGVTQRRSLISISESGLYALIFKSRKAEARRFRKWVTAEVLPAIRKDGEYRAAQTAAGQLARLRKLLLETAEGVKNGSLTPGKAQAIAITGQRYLETLKFEAEAMGYEKVLGLRTGEGTEGILPNCPAGAELLQGLPQPPLPRAEAGEPGLQAETIPGEEGLGGAQSDAGADAPDGAQAQDEEGVR